jgi:outer membrane receptor protein involved in Fe transport
VVSGFAQEELRLHQTSCSRRARAAGATTCARLTAIWRHPGPPDFDAWSPRASLTWRFLPPASAYLSFSRGFRLPDFDEDLPIIFEGFPPGSPPTILLPDLELQRSDAFEIGAKLDHERASAGLALYWMRVDDELLFDPLTFENRNITGRHRGRAGSSACSPGSPTAPTPSTT